MLRYIFTSSKPVNESFVKFALESVIDSHDICFWLIESDIMDQLFQTVILPKIQDYSADYEIRLPLLQDEF